ncbi:MAG TPA: WhiB family transcriptional regulator [Acidimicrobiales bacterium]|nr:WhiB family transcriptional regulator [Acidimicrobiales bacterium]
MQRDARVQAGTWSGGLPARMSWQAMAACRRSPLDFFSADPGIQGQCIALCRRCAVTEQCLRYAVETREPEGVWAGEVFSRRRLRALAQQLGRS